MSVKKSKRVTVAWDGIEYPGAMSDFADGVRLAIRTSRVLIPDVSVSIDGSDYVIVSVEESMTAGFRVAIVKPA